MSWRLLTGHESGNILMFDPTLPHLQPVLKIAFPGNIAVRGISVLESLGLMALGRADGTIQLMRLIVPRSKYMNNARDPTKPVRPFFLLPCLFLGLIRLEHLG